MSLPSAFNYYKYAYCFVLQPATSSGMTCSVGSQNNKNKYIQLLLMVLKCPFEVPHVAARTCKINLLVMTLWEEETVCTKLSCSTFSSSLVSPVWELPFSTWIINRSNLIHKGGNFICWLFHEPDWVSAGSAECDWWRGKTLKWGPRRTTH